MDYKIFIIYNILLNFKIKINYKNIFINKKLIFYFNINFPLRFFSYKY